MSGHSKWHSIKHKKGAEDARRGKIFSRHSKLISVAARGGGDPEMNPALRMAIEYARTDNLPKDNIERAIKKGSGALKGDADLVETAYEGFGPAGVAILVHAITDNKNRTTSAVRNIFTKFGGNMGGAGSTAWMFAQRGVIRIGAENTEGGASAGGATGAASREQLELAAIDAGAEDIKEEGSGIEIYTAPNALSQVKKALEGQGIKVASSKLEFIAKDPMAITNPSDAKKILALLDALEEDDDVTDVFSNFEISEEILQNLS